MTEPTVAAVVLGSVDDARYWLDQNAPAWRMQLSQSSLVPGVEVGRPTTVRYKVRLEAIGMPYDLWIEGEGDSPLAAVQHAVGMAAR